MKAVQLTLYLQFLAWTGVLSAQSAADTPETATPPETASPPEKKAPIETVESIVPHYAPYKDHPALLRGELVQLTRSQIAQIVQSILTLAQRPDQNSSEDFRSSAQLLALAQRLHPENGKITALSQSLQKGTNLSSSKKEACDHAVNKLGNAISNLQKNRNTQSRQLALLLLDPLSQISPNHQSTKTHQVGDRQELWVLSIPPLNQFKKTIQVPKIKPQELASTEQASPEGSSEMTWPSDTQPKNYSDEAVRTNDAKIHHPKTTIQLALQAISRNGMPVPTFVQIDLNLELDNDGELSALSLNDSEDSNLFPSTKAKLKENTIAMTAKLLGKSFHQEKAFLKTAKRLSTKDGHYLSPAAGLSLLLARAHLEPTPADNILIVGRTNNQNIEKFLPPPNLWLYLQSIKHLKNKRIIIPKGYTEELKSILALNKTDFFIENEIYEVSSLKEALIYTNKELSDENHRKALKLFQEFQVIAREKDLIQLSVNAHVRERFSQIKQLMPALINPDLIYLLGSSNRPQYLSQEQFILEYTHSLKKLSLFIESNKEIRRTSRYGRTKTLRPLPKISRRPCRLRRILHRIPRSTRPHAQIQSELSPPENFANLI